jgi:hypothetical protein
MVEMDNMFPLANLIILCCFHNNISFILFTIKLWYIFIVITIIFIYCRLYSQALVKDICRLFFSRKSEKNARTCSQSHETVLLLSYFRHIFHHHPPCCKAWQCHMSMLHFSHFWHLLETSELFIWFDTSHRSMTLEQ